MQRNIFIFKYVCLSPLASWRLGGCLCAMMVGETTVREERTAAMQTKSPATMTRVEKIGHLVLAALPGPDLDDATAALFRERHLGGVILFARNVVSVAQTRALTAALQAAGAPTGLPVLIGADQEGGRVLRTASLPEATHWPAAMAVGATGDLALAEAVGAALGTELRALGINVAFAPDADVNANPRNPVIGARAFGDDPARVAACVVATLRGLATAGVAGTAKHFPGHGDTALDSHLALPTITRDRETLQRVDLVPFAAAIAAGAPLIMTAHIRFPAMEPDGLPATLSRRILTGLLRTAMGYTGVIVTDAMSMGAIRDQYGIVAGCVASMIAGADLVIPLDGQEGAVCDALLAAVADGRLPEAQVDESVRRVRRLRASLALPALTDDATGNALSSPAHRALAREVARRSVTTLAAPPGVLPLAVASAPVVIEFVGGIGSEAEQLADAAAPLLAAVRVRYPRARGVALHAEIPAETSLAAARALITAMDAAADALIIGTSELLRFPDQAAAVATLAALVALSETPDAMRRLVIIAQRGPYDFAALPPLPPAALLTTYSDYPDALAAAVAVLAGDAPPLGRLPVTVSDAFPRGSGLTGS